MRKSNIITYGLSDEVINLRKEGFTISEITRKINENVGIDKISRSSIARFLNRIKNEESLEAIPEDLGTLLNKFNSEVMYKISDLEGRQRSAFKNWYRENWRMLLAKISKATSTPLDAKIGINYDKLIIEMAQILCDDCKKEIIHLVEEEKARREQI